MTRFYNRREMIARGQPIEIEVRKLSDSTESCNI